MMLYGALLCLLRRFWRKRACCCSCSCLFEYEKTFYVIGQAHQFPFAVDLVKSTEQELSEAHGLLDDAEHRLDRLFPLGVQGPASVCVEFCPHVE